MSESRVTSPLTVLTEEETLFRDSVHDFAQTEIAPLARAMDTAGCYDPSVLPKLFEMGLMGIDVPETYGGAGGTFFQACLAVEELSRADAAVGVLVDVQNTLFNNAIERNGTPDQ
jgi:alkylation response protein AidB-like acyl-CoA dehydrogenase